MAIAIPAGALDAAGNLRQIPAGKPKTLQLVYEIVPRTEL
jgi:hypothetical protein